MKAKTKHVISGKDFVGVLPMISVLWKRTKKEYVYFFCKGLWTGKKTSYFQKSIKQKTEIVFTEKIMVTFVLGFKVDFSVCL